MDAILHNFDKPFLHFTLPLLLLEELCGTHFLMIASSPPANLGFKKIISPFAATTAAMLVKFGKMPPIIKTMRVHIYRKVVIHIVVAMIFSAINR